MKDKANLGAFRFGIVVLLGLVLLSGQGLLDLSRFRIAAAASITPSGERLLAGGQVGQSAVAANGTGGNITGRVTDENGQAMQAQIEVGWVQYPTDLDGYYTVPDLAPGDYYVYISSSYYDWWIYVDGRHLENGYYVYVEVVEGKTSTVDFRRPPVDPTADIQVDKEVYSGSFGAGEEVRYSISVRNLGNADATGLVISDVLPAGATYVSHNSGSYFATGQTGPTVVWSADWLGSNYSDYLYVSVGLGSELQAGDVVTNTVTASIAGNEADYSNNTDVVTMTAISLTRDLDIAKSTSVGSVPPGNDVVYTIYYDHVSGNSAAADVVITDDLPPEATYKSYSVGYSGFTTTETGQRVVWTKPEVGIYDYSYIYLTVHVSDTVPVGTVLTNVVRIANSRSETNYNNNVYTHTLTVVTPTRDLLVTKGAYNSAVAPGSVASFYVSYYNNGNSPADSVKIVDTLPEGMTYDATNAGSDSAGWTREISGNQVIWTRDTLAAGASGTLYVSGLVGAGVQPKSRLTNTVQITTTDVETNYGNNASEAGVLTLSAGRDLSVSKSLPYGGQAKPGSSLTYRISYRNSGSQAASNVIITETLPAEVTYSYGYPYSWNMVRTGNIITFTRSSLSTNESGYFDLTVTVSNTVAEGTVFTNTVEIGSDGSDDDPSDNRAELPVTVTADRDLYVEKSLSSGALVPGQNATYEIYYRNYGSSPATNVVLSDTLPAGVSFVSSSGGPTPQVSGNQVIWNLGTVAGQYNAGYYGYLYLTVRVDQNAVTGTSFCNRVDISTTDSEAAAYANTDDLCLNVQEPTRDLYINKSLSGNAIPGGELNYSIYFENMGTGPADNVVLVDTPPASATFLGWSGYVYNPYPTSIDLDQTISPEMSNGRLTWNLGTLNADGYGYIYPKFRLGNDVAIGTVITNGVTITTSGGETSYDNNTSVVTNTVVTPTIDVYVEKWLSSSRVTPDGQATYTIYFENEGDVPANDIIVTDILPDATSYESWSGYAYNPSYAGLSGTVSPIVSGNEVAWNLGTLLPGGRGYIYLTVRVDAGVAIGTVITNTALVSTSNMEGDYEDNEWIDARSVTTPTLDLYVSKWLSGNTVTPGRLLEYGIYFKNEGELDAQNVQIVDTLPLGTTYIGYSGSLYNPSFESISVTPEIADGVVTWNLGNLAAGVYGYLYPRVLLDSNVVPSTTITNTVRIVTSGNESEVGDNTDIMTSHVVTATAANVEVYKYLSYDDYLVPGGKLHYEISFENSGGEVAHNVVISDVLPEHTTYVSYTGSLDNPFSTNLTVVPTVEGNVVGWPVGDLIAGAKGKIKLTVQLSDTVTVGTHITNTVTITTTNIETDITDNTYSSGGKVVTPTVDLLIIKRVVDGTLEPGSTITYEIKYTNKGNSPADTVVIREKLPPEIAFVDVEMVSMGLTGSGITLVPGSGNERRADLEMVPPSKQDHDQFIADSFFDVFFVIGRITDTVQRGMVLTNTVTITTTGTETETVNNESVVTITIPLTQEVATVTPTPTPSATSTTSATASSTPTPTASATATNTGTPSATITASATRTTTGTASPTIEVPPVNTSTPTATPTDIATSTPTHTPPSVSTRTLTPTATATNTATSTVTPTFTPTPSPSATPTESAGRLSSKLASYSGIAGGSAGTTVPLVLRNRALGSTGSWSSLIQVLNVGTVSDNVQVEILNMDGSVAYTMVRTQPPLGSESYDLGTMASLGDSFAGYARVRSTGSPLMVAVQHVAAGIGDLFATAEGINQASSKVLFLEVFKSYVGRDSIISVLNASSTAETLTFTFFNASGAVAYSQTASAAPGGAVLLDLSTVAGLPASARYTVEATGSSGAAALLVGSYLSVNAGDGGATAGNAVNGTPSQGQQAYKHFLPRMRKSASLDGQTWNSAGMIRNLSSATGTVVIEFFAQAGTLVYSTSTVISAGGTYQFYLPSIAGLPSGYEGSVAVTSDQPLVVTGLTSVVEDGKTAAFDGAGPAEKNIFPLVYGDTVDVGSRIFVVNTGSTTVNAEVRFYYPDGTIAGTIIEPLAAGASKVFRPSSAGIGPAFTVGSAVVSNSSGVATTASMIELYRYTLAEVTSPTPTATNTTISNTSTPTASPTSTATASPSATTAAASATATATSTAVSTSMVNMYFQPSNVTVKPGELITLEVWVDAHDRQATAIDAFFDYDKNHLEIVPAGIPVSSSVFISSTTMPRVNFDTADNASGRAIFSAGINPGAPPAAGNFLYATVRFRGKSVTQPSGTLVQLHLNSGDPMDSRNTLVVDTSGNPLPLEVQPATVRVASASIVGSVRLQARGSAPSERWSVPVTVTLHAPDVVTPTRVLTATTDTNGQFRLDGIEPGQYDIKVRKDHSLAKKLAGVVLVSGDNFLDMGVLLEGDANNDGVINSLDYAPLAANYFKTRGHPDFDARVDFNDDGRLNASDYAPLAANYFKRSD